MDKIARKLATCNWGYGDQDDDAFEEIALRIASTGRQRGLITYSDLVEGITFHLESGTCQINIHEWTYVDREILGQFLGRLCAASYARGKFMASALAVGKTTDAPTEGFWSLMRELGALPNGGRSGQLEFWSAQVNKAHAWYAEKEW